MARNPKTGRFAKITQLAPGKGPSAKRQYGGQSITRQFRGLESARDELKGLRIRTGATLLSDVDQRAARIQQRLRGAVLAAYNRAATGRMSRGIFAKAQKVGSAGGGVETVIRITMFNYREARFLTNIGGGKDWHQAPYMIFAKGVEGGDLSTHSNFNINPETGRRSIKHTKKTIGIIKRGAMVGPEQIGKPPSLFDQGVGRLKVPARGTQITAGRAPGAGGAESRFFNGTSSKFAHGAEFFFYPLWVHHPGFPVDVISEVALEEGARFKQEVVTAVTLSHGQMRTTTQVVDSDIPVADLGVNLTRYRSGVGGVVLDKGAQDRFKNLLK